MVRISIVKIFKVERSHARSMTIGIKEDLSSVISGRFKSSATSKALISQREGVIYNFLANDFKKAGKRIPRATQSRSIFGNLVLTAY